MMKPIVCDIAQLFYLIRSIILQVAKLLSMVYRLMGPDPMTSRGEGHMDPRPGTDKGKE